MSDAGAGEDGVNTMKGCFWIKLHPFMLMIRKKETNKM